MIRRSMSLGKTMLSRSALAAALVLGVAGTTFTASPAVAAKPAAGPKLKPSADVIKAIQPVQAALDKKDYATAQTAIAPVEPLLKSNDDRYYYFSMLLNLSIGLRDSAMQDKALRGMLESGFVPPAQAGQFNSVVAENALRSRDYDGALAFARTAETLGYKAEAIYPTMAQALWGKAGTTNLKSEPARSMVAEGLSFFRKGIDALKASGQAVPVQWYQVAIAKANNAGLPELKEWAQMAFDAEPSGNNLRTLLRLFQRENPTMSNRENLDLLRLMYWSGGVTVAPDYIEYAEMAGKGALYGEVTRVIEEGRKKGVLSAGDGGLAYSTAQQQMAADRASLGVAERDAGKAATGKVASGTADAYLGYGDYAKAAELYRLALQKGSVDVAEVNTRLGIALAKAGNAAESQQAFANVQGGIRGEIAKLWASYVARQAATPAS